jgi:predicted TPR repeat methyltransferase
MNGIVEQARTFFLDGVRHYEEGRLAQAEQQFAAALALVPGRPSVLTNLGAVRLQLGRTEEALALLEEAIAREPDNAEALGHCGAALAQLGRLAPALTMFDRSVAGDPAKALVWRMRGSVLKDLGRKEEAARSFREAQARGDSPELIAYYLAGLEAAQAPRQAPRGYVAALFDGYAAQFDSHLVEALRYDAPKVLADRIAAQGRRFSHALDLGCGTGLCGRRLRPLADRLTGVDLSANMLEKAKVLGVYDGLLQDDVVEFLARSSDSYDLVVAGDVFIYVGALEETFAHVAQRMPAGGVFAFTLEESAGPELELRATLRYAHSEQGVRRLAQANGFRVTALERRPVREDQRQPIAGLFCWLERG